MFESGKDKLSISNIKSRCRHSVKKRPRETGRKSGGKGGKIALEKRNLGSDSSIKKVIRVSYVHM